jgi:YHS domain-containing protein
MGAYTDEQTCVRCDAERCSYSLLHNHKVYAFCSLECLRLFVDAAIALRAA